MFCTAVKNTSEKKLYKNNPNLNRFSLFGGCIFFFFGGDSEFALEFFFFRFIFSILHGMADLFVLFLPRYCSFGRSTHHSSIIYIHIYNIYISIRIRVMLFDADPSFMCVSRPTVQKRFCLRSFFFFFFFGFCVLKKRNRAGEFVTSTPARVMWFFFFASL